MRSRSAWACFLGKMNSFRIVTAPICGAKIIDLRLMTKYFWCRIGDLQVEFKEVIYRGGIVKFSIPEAWVAEKIQGGEVIFVDPENELRTLRVNVITAQTPALVRRDDAFSVLETFSDVELKSIKRLENGNAVATGIIDALENNQAIVMFWWRLANICPPDTIRIATFTFTTVAKDATAMQTVADIQWIARSVERANFD